MKKKYQGKFLIQQKTSEKCSTEQRATTLTNNAYRKIKHPLPCVPIRVREGMTFNYLISCLLPMTCILLGWSILSVLYISLYFVLNFISWLHRNPLRVGGIRLQNGLMRWASLMRLKHTCRNECQAQSVGLPKFTLIYTALGNLQQLLVQSHKWLWEQIQRTNQTGVSKPRYWQWRDKRWWSETIFLKFESHKTSENYSGNICLALSPFGRRRKIFTCKIHSAQTETCTSVTSNSTKYSAKVIL